MTWFERKGLKFVTLAAQVVGAVSVTRISSLAFCIEQ